MAKSLGRSVAVLYRQFLRYLATALEGTGLSAGEYLFLPPLYEQDGQSQEQLSQHLSIDKAATARAVRSLEEKGFLSRRRDRQDRRCNRLYLTKKALACQPLIRRALDGWTSLLAAGLPAEQAEQMREQLEGMAERVRKTDYAAYITGLSPNSTDKKEFPKCPPID